MSTRERYHTPCPYCHGRKGHPTISDGAWEKTGWTKCLFCNGTGRDITLDPPARAKVDIDKLLIRFAENVFDSYGIKYEGSPQKN